MTDQHTPGPQDGGLGAGQEPVRVSRGGIVGRLRTYFLTGVIVTAPIGITIYLALGFIDFVDRNITPLIPATYQPRNFLPFNLPGIGVVVLLVGLTLIGFVTASFLGRRLVRFGERLVARMPIIRSIYSALKQIFETMLTQSSTSFRQVVLIEYPRNRVWAIAFLTNEKSGEPGRRVGNELLTVYVPTALNPTSGFLLFVPRQDVIYLDMSVEEGMKLVLSGGVVFPPDHGRGGMARPAITAGTAKR